MTLKITISEAIRGCETLRGLRLLLAALFALFWILSGLLTVRGYLDVTALSIREWATLLIWYWLYHVPVFVVLMAAVGLFHGPIFYRLTRPFFSRVRPVPVSAKSRRMIRQRVRDISVTGIVAMLVAIPIASLRWWDASSLICQLSVLPIGGLLFAAITKDVYTGRERIKRLLSLGVDELYMNVAGKSPEYSEKRRLVAKIRSLNVAAGDDWDALMSGRDPRLRGTSWRGFENLISQLSLFCNCSDKRRLVLYASTTEAIVDACRQALSHQASLQMPPRLVLTDADYPGIHKRLLELCWSMGLPQPQILPFLDCVSGKQSIEDYSRILMQVEPGPMVLCLPHVHFYTGFELPIESILAHIEIQRGNEPAGSRVVIIDGAQAMGNTNVALDDLKGPCFYAFSTHKWLLSDTARGVAYVSPEWNEWYRRPDAPYSFSEQREHMGPMVSPDALFTLAEGLAGLIECKAGLAVHNRQLAAMFVSHARRLRGIECIYSERHGTGIVCLRMMGESPNHEQLETELRALGVHCACYDADVQELAKGIDAAPATQESIKRFCDKQKEYAGVRFAFHGFHTDSSVRLLLGRIEVALERVEIDGGLDGRR